MARPRKPETDRLTEYVGIPLSPVTKRLLDAAARKAQTKPVPYARRVIEMDVRKAAAVK